jgi:ELWxxDGT repeat protein
MTTRAKFAGYDTSGNTNLWLTDGTAAGTSELTAVGAAGSLNPSGITVLGTNALFEGIDRRTILPTACRRRKTSTLSPPSVLATRVVSG